MPDKTLHNKYWSDNVVNYNTIFESTILSGDNYRFFVSHRVRKNDDFGESNFFLEKTVDHYKKKRKFILFEIGDHNYSEGLHFSVPSASVRMTHCQKISYIENMSEADIRSMISSEDKDCYRKPSRMLMQDSSVVMSCPMVPDEVKEWLLLNDVATLPAETKKARKKLYSKLLAATKEVLKDYED